MLAGLLVSSSAVPAPAKASPNLMDLPECSSFKQGPRNIQWCDAREGAGFEPLPGDVIAVDYTARALQTGEVYDGSRNFKFGLGSEEIIPGWEVGILGEGDLPPIRRGGIRTIIVPPELAYGKLGKGCLYGVASACRVPPDSPVQITFQLKGALY